jgi:hypothetical protein
MNFICVLSSIMLHVLTRSSSLVVTSTSFHLTLAQYTYYNLIISELVIT